MVSLATYERLDPDHLAVFSPTIIRDMLRGDLGFRGVVISDALGATAVASIPPATRAIDFIQAGGDMIISNQVPPAIEMAQALADRAARNDASEHGSTKRCDASWRPRPPPACCTAAADGSPRILTGKRALAYHGV